MARTVINRIRPGLCAVAGVVLDSNRHSNLVNKLQKALRSTSASDLPTIETLDKGTTSFGVYRSSSGICFGYVIDTIPDNCLHKPECNHGGDGLFLYSYRLRERIPDRYKEKVLGAVKRAIVSLGMSKKDILKLESMADIYY